MCRETSSPPVSGAAGASAAVEDSRSDSADTRRSEPKNEPTSPTGILSLLPADLPARRGPSTAVLGSDDRSNTSPESPINGRVVSPSDQQQRDQHHQPYNMTYYGGPHGIAPTSQLLQQHRHQLQQHQQLLLQRQHHHLQPSHHLHPAKLTTYTSATDDESTAVEAELYCSPVRDQYYGYSSPAVMQYYTQNAASAAIKCLDDMDRI